MIKRNMVGTAVASTAALLFVSGCSGAEADDGVREVSVATTSQSKPLSWESSDGELLGYEPDVLREIDKQLDDYKFNIQGVDDAAGETGLGTGQYDVLAQALSKSPERKEQFIFTEEPSGVSLMKLYVRSDSTIEDMKDLEGKRIVPVTAGGGVYRFVSQWEEKHPEVDLNYKTSGAGIPFPKLMQQVADEESDALILPSNLGQSEIIKDKNLPLKATEPVDKYNTYFMLSDKPENEELEQAMSEVLLKLRESGKLSELSEKYYGEDNFSYFEE